MPKIAEPQAIGVFDSGFGGLDILRGIVKELPQYDYIYLGDTARTPYGTRSQEVIYEFTRQAVEFLFQKNCGLIILACNTASSEALRKLQQEYLPKHYPDRKILGVLIPATEDAIQKTRNKKIGILATESTVESGAFERELIKLDADVRICQKACPLLVPLVEAGEQDSPAAGLILEDYLKPVLEFGVDTIILGCTHYGIFKARIQKITGPNVEIVSEPEITAVKLQDYLERHPEIERKLNKNFKKEFYSTDLTLKFQKLGSEFFGEDVKAERVNLK